MAATVTLPSDIATSVREMVAAGDFPDTDTAIREAFQLLRDQVEEARFRESIEEGRRAHAEGSSIPWNEDTEARLWARAQELAKSGTLSDPDMWPE